MRLSEGSEQSSSPSETQPRKPSWVGPTDGPEEKATIKLSPRREITLLTGLYGLMVFSSGSPPLPNLGTHSPLRIDSWTETAYGQLIKKFKGIY
jgi:hypothetical protein